MAESRPTSAHLLPSSGSPRSLPLACLPRLPCPQRGTRSLPAPLSTCFARCRSRTQPQPGLADNSERWTVQGKWPRPWWVPGSQALAPGASSIPAGSPNRARCTEWCARICRASDMGTLGGFPCPPAMVRGERSSPAATRLRRGRAGIRRRAAARFRPLRPGRMSIVALATRLRPGRVQGLSGAAAGRVQLRVAVVLPLLYGQKNGCNHVESSGPRRTQSRPTTVRFHSAPRPCARETGV